MAMINPNIIRRSLGSAYENNFSFLPPNKTKGEILVAAKDSIIQLQNPICTSHTISIAVVDARLNLSWRFIGVYGPQGDMKKKMFIREL
jgi:hypothetical protein